jgi:lysophospholipase L1-like esterase
LIVVAAFHMQPSAVAGGKHDQWVGTWSTALHEPNTVVFGTNAGFINQTVRQIVHTSIGGSRVRVVLSNRYGTAPLAIGAAHVALRDKEASIQTASARALTFSGKPTFTIPPGAVVYSDPVSLTIPRMSDVAVDLFLPGDTNTAAPLTMHNGAFQTSYVSEAGNHAGAAKLPTSSTTQNWFVLYRVEVAAPASVGGLVTFGDSITDGTRSTPDTNNRWPDHLVRRMLSQPTPLQLGLMNAGIAGNRVLSDAAYQSGINALARFEHNVAAQPGVTHVIFMEGINDIGQARDNPSPSAEDVIAGHKQIIERAHAHGLKIIGATITPIEDTTFQGYYTPSNEAARQAVNQWIRTNKAYDGLIDFDALLRDSDRPTKLQLPLASSDFIHPNDAGYRTMGNAVNLDLFKSRPSTASR